MLLSQLSKRTDFGLVLNWSFHKNNKWVSAYAPFLVDAIRRTFNPIIISSQRDYQLNKKKLKYILSFEPGWAAPRIKYDRQRDCIKAVIYSDPHYNTGKRWEYLIDNNFDYVLSFYKAPFFFHFKNFPENKFVHFPWAVPDHLISNHALGVKNKEIAIFGGQNSDAYDVRNWCRRQKGITSYTFSGVENKKLTDEQYFLWLHQFEAIVAAGSSNPKYNMVTPKYFEIASAGALLIGQYCSDIKCLGFESTNALLFTRADFIEKINYYKNNPEDFLKIRENGRNLIREKHTLSERLKLLKNIFYEN